MALVDDPRAAPSPPTAGADGVLPGARSSLVLLLLINLFNYIDRYVLAAVEPKIREEFFAPDDPNALAKMGSLATAFMVSYMVAAPVFGWLADRMSRWLLVGIGVILWSLASGGSGLATSMAVLLVTRCFVGIGEAAYGPVAPTILSDLYPVAIRGRILSWFYLAIPVGSALGYVVGGQLAEMAGGDANREAWRWPFYAVVLPGLLLGVWALFMRDPRQGTPDAAAARTKTTRLADYLVLLRIPSYVLDCAGMTAMTFAIGGIGFWMPSYIYEFRLNKSEDLGTVNLIFGGITVVAGFVATLAGGMAGDALRNRFPGSYFLVSAAGLLAGFPMLLLVLWTPFPYAWAFVFLAVFCLFFNTGPSNTVLANVTPPGIRATAFAINIFVIHALGDAISPPLMGWIADRWNMNAAFMFVGLTFLIGGMFWLWGAKYLASDTAAVSGTAPDGRGFEVLPATPPRDPEV